MRSSTKAFAAIIVFCLVVGANEWHRKRERAKQADAYAEAVVRESPRDWSADEVFPASIQTDIVRLANHELSLILDPKSTRAFAAKYFFLAWFPVGESLPRVCQEYGVNIRIFSAAHNALHAEPLSMARSLMIYPHESESDVREQIEEKMYQGVKLQLQNWANESKITVEEGCFKLNQNGGELAAQVNMASFAPKLYAALYGLK